MKIHTIPILAIATMLSLASSAFALGEAPSPPSNVVAADAPDDAGESIILSWALSPNDIFGTLQADSEAPDPDLVVSAYYIERITGAALHDEAISEEDQSWRQIAESAAGEVTFTDRKVQRGWTYMYRVGAVDIQGELSPWAETAEFVTPIMQTFNMSKAWLAIFMLMFGGLIAYFINVARTGKKLWVRPIAGLEAIDEAVGRATEMGRPVLFVTGIQDINEIQTLAGLTVLSRVAKTAAEYGAQIEVPTCRSLVMAAARETVESAYLAAGRPDSYQPDRIHYLTDEQFAFVAGVTGYMVREEPAACIYMGGFYAESLILAETGNHIGAIQVAGTAMPSQLPFFVAACD